MLARLAQCIHIRIRKSATSKAGEFDVSIDGVEKRLGPGDSFYIHPNLDHGAICRKAGVVLDVFSPVRADFLDEDKK